MRRALTWTVAALTLAACDLAPSEDAPTPLLVTRGELQDRVLMTGVLDAAKSVQLTVPRTKNWQIAIRWMADDGTVVAAGDKVVEFDNAAVLESLNELEMAAVEASSELTSAEADNAVTLAEKRFAVVTEQVAVDKAKLEAALPEEIQSRREHRNAKLEYERAKVRLSAAEDDLSAAQSGGKLDEQVKHIAFDKKLRAYRAAERELDQLTLTAPRDGVFSVGTHPWEGRKLQVGDNAWPGLTAGQLPDLTTMVVDARLSDVDDGRIQPGMRVRCSVDAFADRPLMGTITTVSPIAHEPEANSQRRFFAVAIALEENDPEVLRPGLSAKLEVLTRHAEDVVLVPRAALDRSVDPPTARRLDGTEVSVEIDFCTAQACAVTSGLQDGDELLPRGAAQ